MAERDWWPVILGSPIEQFIYEEHPSDETLRRYISGELGHGGQFSITALERGRLSTRAEVTAHLLTCARCAQLVARGRTESRTRPKTFKESLNWGAMRRQWQHLPRPARALMTAQFALILGLTGLLYFKPAPLFTYPPSLENPVATTVLPPAKTSQKTSSPERSVPQLIDSSSDLQRLITNLRGADPQERERAAQLLGESNDPRAISALSEVLGSEDERLRGAAAGALQKIQERLFLQAAQLSHMLFTMRLESVEKRASEFLQAPDPRAFYPFTVRVTFREEASAREIEDLVRRFNALLTYPGQEEFVLQLPVSAGLNLNEIIRELSLHPQIKTVRR